jgi:hypothetical protein
MVKLNSLDYVLYKTHKSVLEACRELMIEYHPEVEIHLKQCTSCGIWLKPEQLKKDLDELDICTTCLTAYGP